MTEDTPKAFSLSIGLNLLIEKLGDTMDPEGADAMVKDLVSALLLEYDARHTGDCPQRRQNYWRMRPEYRPAGYGDDKPCMCGLDEFIGKPDTRAQS